MLSAGLLLVGLPARVSPAEHVPAHVKTYVYYGANYVNKDLPAAYVARHADFAESEITQYDFVNNFKVAGGRYAVMYTDPAFVPYCVPPFNPPAGECKGPLGPGEPESAFLHGPNGERVRRPDDYTHQYQEALNPASPAARAAYHKFPATAVAHSRVDAFFADDSGASLRGPDGTPLTGRFYRFNAPGVEVDDDRRYLSGVDGMMAAAAKPVIINGVDPGTLQPAYGGAMLTAPNVIGDNVEGCFLESDKSAPLSGEEWRKMADGRLAVTALHRYALCMMQGDGLKDPVKRLYALASWWLTYDPNWSVIAPVSPGSDGIAIFADEEIVPAEPLRTARSSVEELRSGGVYAREFARCYEASRPIGHCAAIVNASDSSVTIPHLTQGYSQSLDLSSRSSYGGGTNVWSRDVPRELGPVHAVILRG